MPKLVPKCLRRESRQEKKMIKALQQDNYQLRTLHSLWDVPRARKSDYEMLKNEHQELEQAKRRKEENEVPSRRASTSTNTHRNRDTRNTDDSGTSGNSGNTSNSSNAISTCQTSKASNSSTISNMLGNVKLGDVAMVGVAGAACVVVPPVAAAVTTAITTAAGAAVLGGTVYVAGNVLQCGMKCGTACYVWATSENRDGGNVPLICN